VIRTLLKLSSARFCGGTKALRWKCRAPFLGETGDFEEWFLRLEMCPPLLVNDHRMLVPVFALFAIFDYGLVDRQNRITSSLQEPYGLRWSFPRFGLSRRTLPRSSVTLEDLKAHAL